MKLSSIACAIAPCVMVALALVHSAAAQSNPGAPRAPSPQPGTALPTPADRNAADSALDGVWTGTGNQGGNSWTIRLTLGDPQPAIEYPSLRCGGRWEPIA